MIRPLLNESRKLRDSSTPHEIKLWRYLRNRNLNGHKFRRQYVVEPYIADFCCPDQKFIIELDGGGHNYPEKISKDRQRDDFLREKGYRIFRVWNTEIDQNIEGVLESISHLLPPPSPQPSTTRALLRCPHPKGAPRRGMGEGETENQDWKKPFRFYPTPPPWAKDKEWVLEIGPGNGKFITWFATQHPAKLFIAVELRSMRYEGVGEKTLKSKTDNLITVHGDARYCLPYIFEDESLSEIYILFPDPWFKRRHHKHRLINTERAKLFHRLLKKDGKLFFASDNAPYAEWVKKSFPESDWKLTEGQSLYPTYFETKWKTLGRNIHYYVFQKKSSF